MTSYARHAGPASAGPIRCPSTVTRHFQPYGGGVPKGPPKQGILSRIGESSAKRTSRKAPGITLPPRCLPRAGRRVHGCSHPRFLPRQSSDPDILLLLVGSRAPLSSCRDG